MDRADNWASITSPAISARTASTMIRTEPFRLSFAGVPCGATGAFSGLPLVPFAKARYSGCQRFGLDFRFW